MLYGLTYANNYFVVSGGKYSSTNTAIITYSKVTREVSYSDNDDALYVFNDKIELLGVIDEFISLRWRRKYYEAGEFELVVAPYAKNLELLKKGSIIIRKNYTEAAIIDTKEYDDDGHNIELSVSGRFLSYLLHRRIVKKRIVFSGDILEGEKEILNHITPLSDQFEIEPTIFDSDHVEFQCVYKNVYDHFVDLSKLSNTGFRIVPNVDQKVYRFENFKGNNRTKDQDKNERYCFSKENSNVDKTNSIDTDVNKCNFVLVGGTGEDDSRILKEVTNGIQDLIYMRNF